MEDFANSDATALLKQGLSAATSGNRARARQLFQRVASEHPSNELAWICLAEVSDTLAERMICLRTALEKKPGNTRTATLLAAARKQLAARLREIAKRSLEAERVLPILLAAIEFDPQDESTAQQLMDTISGIVSSQTTDVADPGINSEESFDEPGDEIPVLTTIDAATDIELDLDAEISLGEFAELPSSDEEIVLEVTDEPMTDGLATPEESMELILESTSEAAEQQARIPKDKLANDGQCIFCVEQLKEDNGRCSVCGGSSVIRDPRLDETINRVDPALLLVAVNRLASIVKASPLDAEAHYQLGLAYLNLNRMDAAVRWLKKTQELRPERRIEEGLKALESPPPKRKTTPLNVTRNLGPAPLANGSAELRAAASGSTRNEQRGEEKVVLVIDDSATVRRSIAMILERKGYRVVTAVDGEDGLTKLREHHVDLVLLDVMMPRLDGYQVCKAIRTDNKTLPVVMLSGKDGFFDRVRGKVAGSTIYVTKPFEPQELLTIVAQYAGVERGAPAS